MTTELIDNNNNNKKDRREGKGKVIALSRSVFKVPHAKNDVYYVESESKDGMFYYIGFNPANSEEWCTCFDHSTRQLKCKHIWGVQYAIEFNTVKETDELPKDTSTAFERMEYERDDYSF